MMIEYKINEYDLFLALNILPDGDKTTADSFEKPAGTFEAEKYQWAEGILEYDLLSPVIKRPRTFIVKGYLIADSLTQYNALKIALPGFLYQPYVTLEAVHLGVKANARLQPDGISWHRLTNLDSGKIAVQVQLTFDEILQAVPYKNDGEYFFNVDQNMDLLVTTGSTRYNFALHNGQLTLTQ
jgi:hypothetical protein